MHDPQYQGQDMPNYYNQNNMQPNPMNNQPNPMNNQPNPMNNQPNPFNSQPAAYQPQPMYPAPPPPAFGQPNPMNSAQPMVAYHVISNPSYPPCQYCHSCVPTIARRVTGQAQIFWCFILFLVFPFVCCIPFCMQSCDDIHYECSSCRRITSYRIKPIC